MRYGGDYGPIPLGAGALLSLAISFLGFWMYFGYRDFVPDDLQEVTARIGSVEIGDQEHGEWGRIASPDLCSPLIIPSVISSGLRTSRGALPLKKGDTAAFGIKRSQVRRLNECVSADVWTIRCGTDTILSIDSTNAARRENGREGGPILGIFFLLSGIYLGVKSVRPFRKQRRQPDLTVDEESADPSEPHCKSWAESRPVPLPVVVRVPWSTNMGLSAIFGTCLVYLGVSGIVGSAGGGSVSQMVRGAALLIAAASIPWFLARMRLAVSFDCLELVKFRKVCVGYDEISEVQADGYDSWFRVVLCTTNGKIRIPGPGLLRERDRDLALRAFCQQLARYSSIRYTGDDEALRELFSKTAQ